MKKISTLNELNFLHLHRLMLMRKGQRIDQRLVHIRRIDHQAELWTSIITDSPSLDAAAYLQEACRLRGDLPVLQHVELVGQFFLLLVGVGWSLLALAALVVQRRTTPLHSESTLE
jgi:hypothetical protein